MKRLLTIIFLCVFLIIPVSAEEIEVPKVPAEAEIYMPEDTESFSDGLWYIFKTAVEHFRPELAKAAGICLSLICIAVIVCVLKNCNDKTRKVATLVAALSMTTILLKSTHTMIQLATQTVIGLGQYSKLLIPVLASAMAAQGGVSGAAAIYTGTSLFCAVITAFITSVCIPLVYIFLCLAIAGNTLQEDTLNTIKKFVKWLITWALKISLYVFTGYMGITGVIHGSVDAAAIKATKITISGVVPVVGNIISDASETILVSAGIVKNSAGVYGLLAVISLIIGPFLEVGAQYLMLKITAGICESFSGKELSGLLKDFSTAMGMTLGMMGTVCLLLLIGIVCFMKGIAV